MSTLAKRTLGNGLVVPELGLGCMGMSWAYGATDDAESLKVLKHALDIGVNFWDTAEVYGPLKNEELLGRALKETSRDKVIVATKFAWEISEKGERTRLNSTPAHIKKTIDGSLKRLGTDYIDLYYQHRLDPNTPIEETVGALSDLIREGKIRHIGLSEVGADTIRRAHKTHPITAIQSEYSLWERSVEDKVLPTIRELGIGFVAYSPIGRGFLAGKIEKFDDLVTGDSRRSHPRFAEENMAHNLALVSEVRTLADSVHATPAQVAIAWALKQGKEIVPIPGTKRIPYLDENVASASLKISDAQWKPLLDKLASFKPAGTRYSVDNMKLIDV